MADLNDAIGQAAAGLHVQSKRMRVVAENIANSESTSTTPGGDPYRRKTITFKNELDRATGMQKVSVDKIGMDKSPFKKEYRPGHPSADAEGYVMLPNVDRIVETMDMKEAQRSYEANLGVIEITRSMLSRTVDMLR